MIRFFMAIALLSASPMAVMAESTDSNEFNPGVSDVLRLRAEEGAPMRERYVESMGQPSRRTASLRVVRDGYTGAYRATGGSSEAARFKAIQ